MKLKYYLRGLGIGIAVTVGIMSFTGEPEKLTDAQIRARALELGMVEKSVLADLQEEEKYSYEEIVGEETEKTEKTEETEEITETESNEVENEQNVGEEVSDEDESAQEEEKNESPRESAEEGIERYIIISVVGGNGSETVSQRLFEAGLVNSSVDYNRFLIENGYAKRLRPGNHEIPEGATYEEIARILCRINETEEIEEIE